MIKRTRKGVVLMGFCGFRRLTTNFLDFWGQNRGKRPYESDSIICVSDKWVPGYGMVTLLIAEDEENEATTISEHIFAQIASGIAQDKLFIPVTCYKERRQRQRNSCHCRRCCLSFCVRCFLAYAAITFLASYLYRK